MTRRSCEKKGKERDAWLKGIKELGQIAAQELAGKGGRVNIKKVLIAKNPRASLKNNIVNMEEKHVKI